MSTADERYQEKLRARAEGRTPVLVQVPDAPSGNTQEAVDARYRAKLVAHAAGPKPEKPADAKPEAPAKGEVKNGNGKKGGDGKEPEKPADAKPEAPAK